MKASNTKSEESSIYLSESHRKRFELAKKIESNPPRRSYEERIAQYHRIKAQSTRTREAQENPPSNAKKSIRPERL